MAGIRVELELDDGSFTTRMLHAGESVQQFQKNVGQGIVSINRANEASTRFLSTMRDVTIVFGLAGDAIRNVHAVSTGLVGSVVKVNAEVERLTTLLKGLSRAADPVKEVATEMKYLRDLSKEVPFSIQALADTFVRLKSTGIDPMQGGLKGLTEGIAAFGGDQETLKRAALALSQMSGKGVVQMEELRQQLGEAIPRATELMARSMGTSYTEFVRLVGTGTVEAKAAINAFNMELERTYGGTSYQMMQTFNGLISQIKTNFQLLATGTGGTAFFEAVKTQVRDINNLLDTPAATKFANMLGQGLANVVGYLRRVIDTIIEFRGEIARAAEALAYIFAGKLFLAGISSVSAYFASITLGYNQAKIAAQSYYATQVAVASATNATVGSMVTSTSLLTTGFITAGAAARFVATAMFTVLPQAALLGTAIYVLADAFGWFKNQAKDAWQELDKFGATSMKQVSEAGKLLQQKQDELNELKGKRDYYNRITTRGTAPSGDKYYGEEIARREAELAEMTKKLSGWRDQAAEQEGRAASRREIEIGNKRVELLRNSYDRDMIELDKANKAKIEALAKEKKDTTVVDEQFQRDTRARQLRLYDEEIKTLEDFLKEKITRNREASQEELNAQSMIETEFLGRIRSAREQRRQLESTPLGVQVNPKLLETEKLLEKSQTVLDNLKASIVSNRAEIAGAKGDVEKLIYQFEQLNRGGDPENPKLRKLIEQIKEAAKLNAELEEGLNGKQKFERDIASARQRLEDQIFEAQTRNLNETDKLELRLKNGAYTFPSGQSAMEQRITGIKTELQNTQTVAQQLATTFSGSVFGGTAASAAQTFLDKVTGIARAMGLIKDGMTGLPEGGGGTGYVSNKYGGVSVGGSYLRNLIGQESGGNPNATAETSSAVGLGQFIKGTWMAFLREMHPDLKQSMSEDQALALRKNPEMMKEAIMWYARSNASFLSSRIGPENVNDSTVYLAHFLGPDGAVAALTKTNETMLSAIPQLSAALQSNSFLRGMSVGDLKSFAQRKFGTGSTYDGRTETSYTPRTTADLPENARQSVTELKRLEDTLKKLNNDNALTDKMKEIANDIKRIGDEGDGTAKRVARVKKAIADGDFGKGGDLQDPNSARYKELIKLAEDWDKADELAQKRAELRRKLDPLRGRAEEQKAALAEKEAELRRREDTGSNFKYSDAYYSQMARLQRERDLASQGAKVGLTKENIAEYQRLIDEQIEIVRRQGQLEIGNRVVVEKEKTREINRSLLTERQMRQEANDEQLRQLDALRNAEGLSLEQRAKANEAYEARRVALARQAAQATPLGKQMKEWSDLSGNLEKSMVGWLDSATDALASFITTGKVDFKSLVDSILKDITRLALRWALSGLMGGGQGGKGGGGAKGAVGGAGKAAAGGGGKGVLSMFGIAHTGGVIGNLSMSRMVSPLVFANAPRFHSGGLVGGLSAGEVPIIAKKGEGVFTQEQMAAMGGSSQVITLAPTVNVNATGGKPEDNQDLAEKVGKQVQQQLRGLITSELRQQLRPGGMLNQ